MTRPLTYELQALRCEQLPDVTGTVAGPLWDAASWTPRFVDMVSGLPGLYDTRAACLYSDDGLLIGLRIEDPFPRASLTERDSLIFQDNDIEVFVDVGHSYYELELNALNTVYEVLHVWRDSHALSPLVNDPDYALSSPHTYTFGGDYDRTPSSFWDGTHPRGVRYAFRNFDLPGLVTAVSVDGVLNSNDVASTGWTAEMFLPWAGIAAFAGPTWTRPAVGDSMNLFLGRFQQLEISGGRTTAAWCATPHGMFDTHRPESFTTVRF
jgi:hypothetical protein